ncbi:MAG: hypothetical protein ACOCSF_07290 [Halanaeroarchaeum sp.]
MRVLVSLVVGLLLASVVLSGVAAAEETRVGGSVVVAEGETVSGGLTATSGTVVVHGTVEGDLTVLAGDVLVTGTVTGDVSGAAGSVRIDGMVGGDVSVGAGSVIVGPDAEIDGTLSAGAGSVVLAGTIHDDVAVGGESIRIEDTAVVGGNVEYDGNLEQASGATVEGTVTRNRDLGVGMTGWDGPGSTVSALAIGIWQLLAGFVVGAVLLFVLPRFSESVAIRAIDTPLKSGGVGFLTLIAIPVLVVIFAITIVGIPLAIVTAMLLVPLVFAAVIYGAYVVGTWLISLIDADNKWVALLVGLLVMIVVDLIPWLGGLVQFVVFLIGLGAVVLALYAGFQNRRSPSAV